MYKYFGETKMKEYSLCFRRSLGGLTRRASKKAQTCKVFAALFIFFSSLTILASGKEESEIVINESSTPPGTIKKRIKYSYHEFRARFSFFVLSLDELSVDVVSKGNSECWVSLNGLERRNGLGIGSSYEVTAGWRNGTELLEDSGCQVLISHPSGKTWEIESRFPGDESVAVFDFRDNIPPREFKKIEGGTVDFSAILQDSSGYRRLAHVTKPFWILEREITQEEYLLGTGSSWTGFDNQGFGAGAPGRAKCQRGEIFELPNGGKVCGRKYPVSGLGIRSIKGFVDKQNQIAEKQKLKWRFSLPTATELILTAQDGQSTAEFQNQLKSGTLQQSICSDVPVRFNYPNPNSEFDQPLSIQNLIQPVKTGAPSNSGVFNLLDNVGEVLLDEGMPNLGSREIQWPLTDPIFSVRPEIISTVTLEGQSGATSGSSNRFRTFVIGSHAQQSVFSNWNGWSGCRILYESITRNALNRWGDVDVSYELAGSYGMVGFRIVAIPIE